MCSDSNFLSKAKMYFGNKSETFQQMPDKIDYIWGTEPSLGMGCSWLWGLGRNSDSDSRGSHTLLYISAHLEQLIVKGTKYSRPSDARSSATLWSPCSEEVGAEEKGSEL